MNSRLPWDVEKVTNMAGMFNSCHDFEGSGLDTWNTGTVEYMNYMFYGCYNLSADIKDWDVGKVTQMEFMLYDASEFNANLSQWNVDNVRDMSSAFAKATSFDQDLCAWGEKVPVDVRVDQVFAGSECQNTTDPVSLTEGPWCRNC